ncbi:MULTISPECIES: sensor domain-containing diguanylate cyclase [unclassified Rhizobium]|uniref:sensor domain-containing diguanylate cyclase n=1 Tax=unclassified Rhizobium TaxID=2613769 RepID=UPI000EAAB825|nr:MULTISPECIES: sensor domain-containing diguanylate cyclase [unclassified Rhizobium]AYG68446.1 sensor domain-containing diguanylate cyclase [Rhizobium sp. CCGE531]AYG74830.1 sensor domain-containing diguanylate cyclase [Rhizobium sp. CCGE532]
MRITTITNWAYGITVVLTVLSAVAFILSARSAIQERQAVEQHLLLNSMGEELALAAEETTDEARLYVMRGAARHLDAFTVDEGEERRRDTALNSLRGSGIPDAERQVVEQVAANAEGLDKIEEAAVAAYTGGNQTGARDTLFGPEHERIQMALLNSVSQFRTLAAARTETAVRSAQARSDLWADVAKVMLALTAAVFLGVLYFIMRRRVALPLIRMTGIVNRLAKQDYAVEVPTDRRRDEIGEMNDAIQIFRENGLERNRLDAERKRDLETKDLILQMMHRLQACYAQNELAEVVALFVPQIFPGIAGCLYMMNESRTALTEVSRWLEPAHTEPSFPASACWGLRRGRPHVSHVADNDIPCQHLDGSGVPGLCVPLTALGEAIGLLYFEDRSKDATAADAPRLYLELIAENIGLAIANLQLRDRLINLAVRDALTGLLNRRSLDEMLNNLYRDHSARTVICMMIDIDHFKRFNDEFGHDAGDEVLRHVGQIVADTVAETGTVYRFGGEELTVIATDMADQAGFALAEQLRARVFATPFSYRARIVGPLSVSVGIASSPASGPAKTLINRADGALLKAKLDGRNRTVAAFAMEPEEELKRGQS